MTPPSPPADAIGALAQRFEVLRAAYERFLNGLERTEPLEARKQFIMELQRASRYPSANTGHNFRLQALKARVLTYEAMWNRAVTAMEASHRFRRGGRATASSAEAALAPPKPTPPLDPTWLHQLHQEFTQAAEKSGQTAAMGYEAFATMVARQMERIRERTGWQQVGLRVTVENDKPALRAFRKS